jgi:hypothetical protein
VQVGVNELVTDHNILCDKRVCVWSGAFPLNEVSRGRGYHMGQLVRHVKTMPHLPESAGNREAVILPDGPREHKIALKCACGTIRVLRLQSELNLRIKRRPTYFGLRLDNAMRFGRL